MTATQTNCDRRQKQQPPPISLYKIFERDAAWHDESLARAKLQAWHGQQRHMPYSKSKGFGLDGGRAGRRVTVPERSMPGRIAHKRKTTCYNSVGRRTGDQTTSAAFDGTGCRWGRVLAIPPIHDTHWRLSGWRPWQQAGFARRRCGACRCTIFCAHGKAGAALRWGKQRAWPLRTILLRATGWRGLTTRA